MIELRWLVRKDDHLNEERVLQWREGHYSDCWTTNGKPDWVGSEWRDVPTVREGGG